MLIKNYRTQFVQALASIFDEKEIESFFYIILEAFHQLKRVDLVLSPDLKLDNIQLLQWETVLLQLKEQKPIQYILGETQFFGLPFYVNKNTLIPRPETEELVEWIIKENLKISSLKNLKILDIGTGSGCIAISLAKNLPNASVFAIDVSDKALATAQKNAVLNEVDITFIEKNILQTEDLNQEFDIIVSNPPYVRNLEKKEIHKNVLEYEPHLALFVEDNDSLLFYRKITELATRNLSNNGQLYFEINQYLGKETVELLEKYNFKNTTLKKDIYGNDRMIKVNFR
ncbi:peptide chain release factor N(5)-glutamine methyltransferase [Flavobacterium psychrophilum]|uniref:peptide chain release factor N(5)-glutamine methyltransferase n=1 Tax=Flavobacterium psychrophilum TaxID=96345 RepID=UPI000B7C199A|nr:peptide chain release factor N(5)-glutamine methyltransferase [Flavobacterium psychrophilum]QRE60894.1 peptide chain release factor N(5)-glutamine methyltransferase [Flavobacterium psychrophilum]QRE63081.1 peptide chain release factor N(5)-glutamine methyltransferase [Flavobacterium psychrophilum]SNA87084.1 Release factor glutamine methyltransferase [Flavobacterium psychrophilum]SNB36926.1 Release factor glutamine methyltransferase [Flavobacterium psychrophilum]SNB43104.1 Release factor glu